MSRQVKFLLGCFITCVILWLAFIGGLITAAVIAYRLAEDPSGWMAAIWVPGLGIALFAFVGLAFFADEVRRFL